MIELISPSIVKISIQEILIRVDILIVVLTYFQIGLDGLTKNESRKLIRSIGAAAAAALMITDAKPRPAITSSGLIMRDRGR